MLLVSGYDLVPAFSKISYNKSSTSCKMTLELPENNIFGRFSNEYSYIEDALIYIF